MALMPCSAPQACMCVVPRPCHFAQFTACGVANAERHWRSVEVHGVSDGAAARCRKQWHCIRNPGVIWTWTGNVASGLHNGQFQLHIFNTAATRTLFQLRTGALRHLASPWITCGPGQHLASIAGFECILQDGHHQPCSPGAPGPARRALHSGGDCTTPDAARGLKPCTTAD